MNITIITGGTGSIALQTGLYDLINRQFDGVNTTILVNAYDNGLSTGDVRRVCNSAILGPSDVRKNQTTQLKLINPTSPWLSFLNIRFTTESVNAEKYCLKQVCSLFNILHDDAYNSDKNSKLNTNNEIILNAIKRYFSNPQALIIDYNDFSLANIIYAGLAQLNDNSLRKAASIMSFILGIKDNVILNDDTSLFLGAITNNGTHVTDEANIVSWDNEHDSFKGIYFTDSSGKVGNPKLCDEATNALLASDLIILSSGTQWSSLIPTYVSDGFMETIAKCTAKIILVMNRIPDRDSPGQTGEEIIRNIVPNYFPENKLDVIIDTTGNMLLNNLTENLINTKVVKSINAFDLSTTKPKVHDSNKLGKAVLYTYFNEILDSNNFVFDYDDTLIGRGNTFKSASQFNEYALAILNNKLDVRICTGNSIKAVAFNKLPSDDYKDLHDLTIYADGGNNVYTYSLIAKHSDAYTYIRSIDKNCQLDTEGDNSFLNIINKLVAAGIPISKIENRGNSLISIKPIDNEYRLAITNLVKYIVNDSLQVKMNGRTTIDICKHQLDKSLAIKDILKNTTGSVVYVGDELYDGNDTTVTNVPSHRLKYKNVSSPVETAVLMTTLLLKDNL